MSSRKQATARAIAESVELSQGGKPKDPDPPQKPRGQCNAGLYASWGASDLHLFFRFRSSVLGLKAQAIEPQAETLGKRLTPFWDAAADAASRNPRLQERPARLVAMLGAARGKVARALARLEKLRLEDPDHPKLDTVAALHQRAERAALACELALDSAGHDIPGGVDAMPTAGREVRSVASPDRRISDESLEAVTNLRRIEAGLAKVSALNHATLEVVFLPPRTHHKIEEIFQELSYLVLNDITLNEAFDAAMAMSKRQRRISIEAWLVQRLGEEESKRQFKMDSWQDLVIDGAVTRAEEHALEAIRAYEDVAAMPLEVRDEPLDDTERKRRKRTPKPTTINLGHDPVSIVDSVARASALLAIEGDPS